MLCMLISIHIYINLLVYQITHAHQRHTIEHVEQRLCGLHLLGLHALREVLQRVEANVLALPVRVLLLRLEEVDVGEFVYVL
jgi:hypothetical protein